MKEKLILLIFIITGFISAQDNDTIDYNTGILYGKNHVFTLTAPKGWVLDNQSGVSQGLHAVFYPEGGSWNHSKAVMYAQGNAKDSVPETIRQFIAYDSLTFKQRDPSIKIMGAPSVKTEKQGKHAIVKWFFYSQYEAVAYIDEEKSVAMIVLTSRTEEDFKNSYPAFEELVKTYYFMSDIVTFPEN